MAFLALAPGMHTIEALILTDIETQHALILRYDLISLCYLSLVKHILHF
jgi:hypothetical protein